MKNIYIIVISENIFTMFIVNDNLKIMKILKRLFLIYKRSLYLKKIINFHKYQFNINLLKQYQSQKFGFNLNKQNIHDKLYNGLKLKEEKLNELARKYNEEEEKLYSFTPQINNKRISFNYNPIKLFQNNQILYPMKFNSISYENNKINTTYKNYPISLTPKQISKSIPKTISRNKNPNFNTINSEYTYNEEKYKSSFDIPNYLKERKKGNKSFSENNKLRKEIRTPNFTKPYLNSINDGINNHNHPVKTLSSSSISDNLSLLFSSRLNINTKKIYNKKDIPNKSKKVKKSLFDNSSSSNLNEKGTNYMTEKGSRTEHLSTLNHELNNSKKLIDKKKKFSSEGLYPFRTGIIPYTYSTSRKSTNFISPKLTDRNNIIINRSNYFGTFSNYLNNSRDENKLNNKRKNTDGTSSKSNNINSNNYLNTLEIQSNVVNEKIINNEYMNEKLSRISSNSQMTIQTISDSKLFDIASYYVRTDDSLERFRILNKYNNNEGIKGNNNNNNK